MSSAPVPSWSSRTGSARLPATGKEGPIARTITFFCCVPVTIKPPINTLSPVSTRRRVEILASRVDDAGGGVAGAVGVELTVGVNEAVGACVGDGFGAGVVVGVAVGVG